MHALLAEAHWTKNGLPLRTAGEALKHKKTGVSEALRKYAAATKQGAYTVAGARAMEGALKSVSEVLKALLGNSKGNTKLIAHVNKMLAAVDSDVNERNGLIDRINLAGVEGDADVRTGWESWAAGKQFTPEWECFLKMKAGEDPLALARQFVNTNRNMVGVINPPEWKQAALANDANAMAALVQRELTQREGLAATVLDHIDNWKKEIKVKI